MTTQDDTETIEGLELLWPSIHHVEEYTAQQTNDGLKLMLLDVCKAARRYAQQDGWRDIESAPKDGTWVLLWCGWQIVGRFVVKGRRVKKGWTDDMVGLNPIYHVTHWMPLPAAPKPEGE
jgi:hypothetical protein